MNVIDIRLPNITATDEAGQIAQMRSYLYQFAEQLQWAFNSISNGETMESYRATQSESSSTSKEEEAKNTFSDIKSLIIKSADIVEAYYKQFGVMLETEGKYMAKSDFGTYYEESSQTLSAKYDRIEAEYKSLETVINELNNTIGSISNNAIITSGMLRYEPIAGVEGVKRYGISIQQRIEDEVTKEVTYEKIAMLTSDGLELFDSSTSMMPRAIYKYNNMYVTNAEIFGSLKIGGYNLDTSKGLSFKWVGKGE